MSQSVRRKSHPLGGIRQKLGPGVPSASGKTRVVFSTNGNQVIEDGQIDGKAVTVGINAYFRP